MEIIDAHAHIYPEKIAAKATSTIGEFYDIKMDMPSGTPEELLRVGRNAGITGFVVHSVATTAHQVRSINGFIQRECEAHPEFIGFITLHQDLTEEEKILLETPMEERIDFDALFVYEDGVKLQQVISLLAYYDVTPKVVPFYGLANWQSSRDKGLVGGYFTATPTDRLDVFTRRYQKTFGAKPPRISSLAYDAVSLVAHLAQHQALTTGNLLQEKGFNGVNGRFRINSDGTNDRLLEVRQFQPGLRQQIIVPVPETFLDKESYFVEPEPDLPETEFFFTPTDNTPLE